MREWTDETDREAAPFFDSLPEREIRRRQGLCAAQQRIAFETRDEDALADLERMSNALAASMMRRLDATLTPEQRAEMAAEEAAA